MATAKKWKSPNGQWEINEVVASPKGSLNYQEGKIAGATISDGHYSTYVYLTKSGKLVNYQWVKLPKYVEQKAISMMMAQVNKPAKKTVKKKAAPRRR